MIIVRLTGRMGNQLFQYAFALSEQRRLNTYAIIDDRSQQDIVSGYFDIKGIFRQSLIKKIVFKFHKFPMVYQEGPDEAKHFFSGQVRNWRYYYAYLQSELYFNGIKDQVKKRFRIKQPFQDEFQRKYGTTFKEKKVLAIHYRFGDYVSWTKEELGGTDFTLPVTYYKNALDQVPDLDQYLIILVTDDIETCNARTEFIKNKMVISDTEIMDFQILMNADKLIIANSSFSWWAAYLNVKNAQVFAPEYWLGFKVKSEFPNGIIPSKYIQVQV
jgi:hypothetical protein